MDENTCPDCGENHPITFDFVCPICQKEAGGIRHELTDKLLEYAQLRVQITLDPAMIVISCHRHPEEAFVFYLDAEKQQRAMKGEFEFSQEHAVSLAREHLVERLDRMMEEE